MHWVKLHSDPHTGADGGHIDSATATAAKILWSIVTRRKTDHRKALVKSFPVVPPAALHDVLGKSDRDPHCSSADYEVPISEQRFTAVGVKHSVWLGSLQELLLHDNLVQYYS